MTTAGNNLFQIHEPWEKGYLIVRSDTKAVTSLSFSTHPVKEKGNPLLKKARRQLREFLGGTRTHFDLPLKLEGTAFQKLVWEKLQQVPFGTVVSYGELAAAVGRPRAYRAVGGACGKNPIPLIIPCHRVLASGGALGGFSGGLQIKTALLQREGAALR